VVDVHGVGSNLRYVHLYQLCSTVFKSFGKGDLTYLNLAGSDVIVLHTLSAATTLLKSRGANFSDRPSLRFLSDIVGWKDAPGLLNLGPTLMGHRKRFLQVVGSTQYMDSWEDIMCEAVLKCLGSMMEEPQRLDGLIRLCLSPFPD
jgi:hypothetical protein